MPGLSLGRYASQAAFEVIEKPLFFVVFQPIQATGDSLGASVGVFLEVLTSLVFLEVLDIPGGTQCMPGGYWVALGAALGSTYRGIWALLESPRGTGTFLGATWESQEIP